MDIRSKTSDLIIKFNNNDGTQEYAAMFIKSVCTFFDEIMSIRRYRTYWLELSLFIF